MKSGKKIIECVANISYGIEDNNLKKVITALTEIQGQKLLNVDSSASANRSVLTFAGIPDAVFEAAFKLYKTVGEIVDMRLHKGSHPRIGAVDVCPFVALKNISKKELTKQSIDFAERVGQQLQIPVYLYEFSARKSYRYALPDIRKGGYEKLYEKMQKSMWQPDFGPNIDKVARNKQILKFGATIIGVRNILVAFNISIDTQCSKIAKKIAYRIRTAGWPKGVPRDEATEGFLKYPSLRAIGWYSTDYGCAQVSCNFLNYRQTSPLKVWEQVKILANDYGCQAIGCEVIGLIPEQCILDAGNFVAEKEPTLIHDADNLIDLGVSHFKFNTLRPFSPNEKILEYRLNEIIG